MLYKYIGNKFKIDGDTILSEGDTLTVKKDPYFEGDCITNNTTGKEIPKSIHHDIAKHLVLLDKINEDIDEFEESKTSDRVSHPGHYTWLKELCGVEVIDITRHMDFDLGNAIKYILRCGHKEELGYSNKEKTIEDLQKAIFYLNDKIKMLEG